jgi:nucleoside-diphosphate-sugar epimerase
VGVLGQPGKTGIREEDPLIAAGEGGDYHTSKALGEQIVQEHAAQQAYVIMRPTVVYGPGDMDGMITRLIEMIAARRFVRVGNGRNLLHLTYIDDLVCAIRLAATLPGALNQTLIPAGPDAITSAELYAGIERLVGAPHARLYLPEWFARPVAALLERAYRALRAPVAPVVTVDKIDNLCRHRSYDGSRSARLLGFSPAVTCADGLSRTVEWMRAVGRLPA